MKLYQILLIIISICCIGYIGYNIMNKQEENDEEEKDENNEEEEEEKDEDEEMEKYIIDKLSIIIPVIILSFSTITLLFSEDFIEYLTLNRFNSLLGLLVNIKALFSLNKNLKGEMKKENMQPTIQKGGAVVEEEIIDQDTYDNYPQEYISDDEM
jgi:H+/gluconate symporter-like permease